jgi:hypothetical protein
VAATPIMISRRPPGSFRAIAAHNVRRHDGLSTNLGAAVRGSPNPVRGCYPDPTQTPDPVRGYSQTPNPVRGCYPDPTQTPKPPKPRPQTPDPVRGYSEGRPRPVKTETRDPVRGYFPARVQTLPQTPSEGTPGDPVRAYSRADPVRGRGPRGINRGWNQPGRGPRSTGENQPGRGPPVHLVFSEACLRSERVVRSTPITGSCNQG